MARKGKSSKMLDSMANAISMGHKKWTSKVYGSKKGGRRKFGTVKMRGEGTVTISKAMFNKLSAK